MSEVLHEGRKRPRLRTAAGWFWHHPRITMFLTMFLSLFLLVLLLGLKPVAYLVTHVRSTNCGELSRWDSFSATSNASKDLQNEVAGMQDVRCFVQAHQHCRAATLTLNTLEVDRSYTTIFGTANSVGGCAFSEISYISNLNFADLGYVFPDDYSDCRSMQQEPDGLHFLGCEHDVPDVVFRI